jgi:hypothetical protein
MPHCAKLPWLECGKSFTFDIRVVRRSRNEPFWPGDICHIVPSYHGNGNKSVKLARAMLCWWQNSITAPWLSLLSFNKHFVTTCDNFDSLWQIGPREKIYNQKTNQKSDAFQNNHEFCKSSLLLTNNYVSWVTIFELHTTLGIQSYFRM